MTSDTRITITGSVIHMEGTTYPVRDTLGIMTPGELLLDLVHYSFVLLLVLRLLRRLVTSRGGRSGSMGLIILMTTRKLLLDLLLQPLLPPPALPIIFRRAGAGAPGAVKNTALVLLALSRDICASRWCAAMNASCSPITSRRGRSMHTSGASVLDWIAILVRLADRVPILVSPAGGVPIFVN